jgi:protein-S-isoprenylcysteine O-methyltransferase Ste14
MWVRGIIGVLLCLIGGVWIAQGTGALGGSMMSGHSQYAVLGVVVALIGIALLVWAWRVRDRRGNG